MREREREIFEFLKLFRAIGEPKSKIVNIQNIGSEIVKLESISGSTTSFYCSFFKDNVCTLKLNVN